MKKKKYRKGVQAVIFDEDNKFLLVQLQHYKDNEWNIIGGGAELDEPLEESLKREINEELGLTDQDYEILAKSSIPRKYNFPEPLTREGVVYDGQVKEQFLVKFIGDKTSIKLQNEEVRKLAWVPFEKLKDYLIFPNQYSDTLAVIKELLPDAIIPKP